MVSERRIYGTQSDLRRLTHVVLVELSLDPGSNRRLAAFMTDLQRATIVEADQIPDDVVTMNSTVVLRDLETNETESYTLVYPDRADIARNRLSVLAPIGTAILGHRVGDVVQWRVSAGVRRVCIEQVLVEPERASALRHYC
jgi:regulator of nucleoside diphosphate kinase